MGLLIKVEDFDNFKEVCNIPLETVSESLQTSVRNLDEREELEPFIRSILYDYGITPHGPAEIVDILTHRVTVKREDGLAGFILKGKSFPTVRHKDVAHQIYRLGKITGLRFAVFAAVGTILDQAKEHFTDTAECLGCKYAIFDVVDIARLLVAYGYLCPRDGRKICGGRCKCGYSPKKRKFNLLQDESLKILGETHAIGRTSGLIVLPPGSGKTRIAAEDAKKFGAKRVLYIAHTNEILDVAQSEFEAVFEDGKVARHTTATTLAHPNKVNITTIQLLWKNRSKITPGEFDYLVVDEFHHSAAKTYREIVKRVEPLFLLGLTATPFRGDRQNILDLCNKNVLVNFELRTGIDNGILSPYHYFGCFDDIDYSNIRHNGYRYDIHDLEKALIIPERDAAIIGKWRYHADGKPTLAFCYSHRHAYRVAQSFQSSGIPAEVYISTTPMPERRNLINKLQDGDLSVLCVVDVLNEGADIPFVECLLFLRPTESARIFYQQLGRGLRRYVGKSHCIVVDFIGNFKNAYKIVEYQPLLPCADDEVFHDFTSFRGVKQVFDLPLGCEVHFDDRVINIFAEQRSLDPAHASRHNIGRILIYQYLRLVRRLKRKPSKREVDHSLLLGRNFYTLVFGSWKNFDVLIEEEMNRVISAQ